MEDLDLLDNDARSLVLEYITAYLNFQKEKKLLQREISNSKKKFKELGLPVNLVMKAFKTIKDEKKSDERVKNSIEQYKIWISENQDISELIDEIENM